MGGGKKERLKEKGTCWLSGFMAGPHSFMSTVRDIDMAIQ